MLKSKPGLINFNYTMKLNYAALKYGLLYIGLSFIACDQHEKASVEKHQLKPNQAISEDEAVNLITKLDEVRRKNELVVKESKRKRHLSTYVETPPTTEDPNYYVKVAENNGGSYVTYYIFAVNGKTSAISFYDVLNDKLLPLNTWRRTIPLNER
jgi:hypothetical protein